jgi:hypothetical protein
VPSKSRIGFDAKENVASVRVIPVIPSLSFDSKPAPLDKPNPKGAAPKIALLISLTLVNGFLTFVPPLVGARTPALPEYLFFATIETVCTSVIIRQARTWSEVKPAVSSARVVGQPEAGITSS